MPEFVDEDAYHPPTRHFAGVRKILPQQMFENGPDALHFCFVHGAGELVSITPVDRDHSMTFSTTAGKGDSSGGPLDARTVGMMDYQHAQIERDFSIWESQIYVLKPPFSGPEQPYFGKFRRFVRAYYPDEALEMEDVL